MATGGRRTTRVGNDHAVRARPAELENVEELAKSRKWFHKSWLFRPKRLWFHPSSLLLAVRSRVQSARAPINQS